MPNGIPPAVSSPGTTRVGTPATLNRLTSARPAVKASCGASMDGAVEKGHRQQQEIHLERGEEGVDLPRKSLLVEQGGVVGFGRRLLAILVVG